MYEGSCDLCRKYHDGRDWKNRDVRPGAGCLLGNKNSGHRKIVNLNLESCSPELQAFPRPFIFHTSQSDIMYHRPPSRNVSMQISVHIGNVAGTTTDTRDWMPTAPYVTAAYDFWKTRTRHIYR